MTDATAPLGSEAPKSKHAASLFDEDARYDACFDAAGRSIAGHAPAADASTK